MSSIQCTWTRENFSDDQLVRVRLSFPFLFWMHQNMNLAKSVFFLFPLFVCFCIALVCFRKTKFLLNTLVRKKHFLRSSSSQSLGTFSQHQIHVRRH